MKLTENETNCGQFHKESKMIKKVEQCKQKCPVCMERCLGAAPHKSEIEHQCSKHFWFVGGLDHDLFRRLVRDIRSGIFKDYQYQAQHSVKNDIAL